jgi:uncharacterized membrane protein
MLWNLHKTEKLKTSVGNIRLVLLVAVIFFVLCLIFSLNRYYSFYASFDQGIFNQLFWNSIHGRLFESSLSSSLSTNVAHNKEVAEVFYKHLGQHFNPIFLLWLPLYALFPSSVTLLVLQVTLVTAAGLVLYVLARQYLEPALARMITVSFYSANAVIGPTLSNFHDISATPLFVFALLLAMEKRRWWVFGVFAVMLLAVREDSGVALFSIGFYLIMSKRYPRIGLAVCISSFSYMLLLTETIMPSFSQDVSQRMMIERFGNYASGKEATPLEIIWAIVSNPFRLLEQVFSPWLKKIRYLIAHWLPLAFVPAISTAAWATAGFPILYIFLQRGQSPLGITIRYAMPVVPGLFYGAILWWSQHPKAFKPSFRRLWVGCICASIFFSFTSNPNRTFDFLIPYSVKPWVYVSLPQQWHHVGQFRSLLAQIPSYASVSATTYLVPHLSSRREIIRLPALELRNDAREVIKVDYAIADLWQLQQYAPAFKSDRAEEQELIQLIDRLTTNQEYGIIGFEDGVILLKKSATSKEEAKAAWLAFRKEVGS